MCITACVCTCVCVTIGLCVRLWAWAWASPVLFVYCNCEYAFLCVCFVCWFLLLIFLTKKPRLTVKGGFVQLDPKVSSTKVWGSVLVCKLHLCAVVVRVVVVVYSVCSILN